MKLSVWLAFKNLRRNKKYALGLFFSYFIVSILCLGLFLFSIGTRNAYDSLLSRQASASYVAVSAGLNYEKSEPFDFTDEQVSEMEKIPHVERVEKFLQCLIDARKIKLDEMVSVDASVSVIASDNQNVSPAYKKEFSTITDENLLICGREIDVTSSDNECLISDAFTDFLGATSADDLLGRKLVIKDFFSENLTKELVIVGVLNKKIADLADMHDKGKCFVFVDMEAVLKAEYSSYYYKLYADYYELNAIEETVKEFSFVDESNVGQANDDYSVKQLAKTIKFVSAIFILISVLSICVAVAFVSSAAILRFLKAKPFYNAAFAVGLSKRKLELCFLTEFSAVALIAFAVAIPVSFGLVNLLSYFVFVFVGIKTTVDITAVAVIVSVIPLIISACASLFVVDRKLNFGAKDKRSDNKHALLDVE